MRWVSADLKRAIADNRAISNDWPRGNGESWLQHVYDAVRNLERQGIPDQVLPATASLFQHCLLQNAGIYRRHAIETLLAGGWVEPVTSALAKFLDLEKSESWIRTRAEFALGFLQHPDEEVAECLSEACLAAYANLTTRSTPAQVMEMHTVLFAIGDCFGAVSVDQRDVYQVRERIRNVLWGLVDDDFTHKEPLYPAARATAYVLTFTAQPRKNEEKDMAEELLDKLQNHPDITTRSLARWALENRIDRTTGEVKPLVHAKLLFYIA